MKLVPIQPKNLGAQFKALPGAVKKGMRQAAEKVKEDFEQTTATWEHEVAFTITPDGDNFIIGTDDQRWKWIDEGTEPFQMPAIVPKNKKALTIVGPGVPKTMPGRVRSGSGSKGGIVVIRRSTKSYTHPGIKARNFSGTIRKRWQRGVAPFIRTAIREVLH